MAALRFYWIEANRYADRLPQVDSALDEPNGLLAAGGDLAPATLLAAYRLGVFPWYSEGQPILWWSPDPRTVLLPSKFHVSRSLDRCLRQQRFRVTANRNFAEVIAACGEAREIDAGTWITADMRAAYTALHDLGHAHSVECWQDDQLVGGLYGVALGRVFFGESMFSRASNASKVAMATLCRWLVRWGYALLDCQVASTHLRSLGAVDLPRARFVETLATLCTERASESAWRVFHEVDAS